ncbi:MAG: hypothetical protein NC548_51100 [Lachnospiraceae bacterium]|nr:hypothetical protein [Lachnospiraceae bacterium]
MKQYCRYCCSLCVGDAAYCSTHRRTMSEAAAKAQNRCSSFLYNPIDAFGGIDRDGKTHEYTPREKKAAKKTQCDGQMSLELFPAAGARKGTHEKHNA